MANAFFTAESTNASVTLGDAATGLDLNNDGISDSAFGGTQMGTGNGVVAVVYGTAGGFDPTVDLASLTALQGFTLTGAAVDDEFGYALAAAENLDGSGNDALLIGARGAGTVSVVMPGQTSVGFTVTGLPVFADGLSVAGLGDFNGDGIGDFAIGTPDANSGSGAVHVIFGSNSLGATLDISALDGSNGFTLAGFGGNAMAGFAISSAGDLDGDGKADLLIGVPGDADDGLAAGTAFVVHGGSVAAGAQDIATTTLNLTSFTGATAGDETGAAVAGGADVNGNGLTDIIIGAPLADPGGASSGVAYVVFDSVTPPTQIDLAALDGTNGFQINGLTAQDRLGASVQMMGDISGDGIGDIGVLTASGDVYLVYGSAANTGGSVDLGALDGSNGIAFTGLFDTPGAQVSLNSLGDINKDPSGAINDFAITASYTDGTPGESLTILGGTANFAALDAADGAEDGVVGFAQITAPVAFVETNITIVIGGDDTGTLSEDTASTTGAISITDTSGATSPSFAGRGANGALGVFAVNSAGTLWTYTVNDNSALQYLAAGISITDTGTLVADNGSQQEITITVNGVDDPAIAIGDVNLTVAEDFAKTLGTIALTDADAGQDPSLSGAIGAGQYGNIVVASDGTYTYNLTDPTLQALVAGETRTDVISLTDDAGASHTVNVTINGADEGTPITLDGGDNTVSLSYGDDIIDGLGGNDTIDAGAGDDTVDAGDGDDTVTDALGDDIVFGGDGNDRITLTSGNNAVNGGDGADFIVTGFQNDTIDGGAGNDVIAADVGGTFVFGNNDITGGTGDDVMMGGQGIDTFIFAPNAGSDVIGTFDPATVTQSAAGFAPVITGPAFDSGIDKVALDGFSGVNAGNVLSFVSATANGAEFAAQGTTILLRDVLASDLDANDFVFL